MRRNKTHRSKIDNNQNAIVKSLRQIAGVSVQPDVNDILVGYQGHNYWFEIKSPSAVSKTTGRVLASKMKPSQEKLLETWRGQYSIVWSLDQILKEIGINEI